MKRYSLAWWGLCDGIAKDNMWQEPSPPDPRDEMIRHLRLTIATQARTIQALRERLGEDHA